MATPALISFGDFRLDPATRRLRRAGDQRPLRAKSAAVLLYLARHPNRLVTHAELLRAVWPDTAVSPPVLRVCIREVREALGADADRFLATVPRRGYRFTLDVAPDGAGMPIFVGRAPESALLHDALARARGGRRQVVLVSGEAGAGKTALVDHFLNELRGEGGVRLARGQALELHGGVEAYGPIVDLLSRLSDEAEGDGVVRTLSRRAPSWLAQLPGRIHDGMRARPRRHTPSTTRERRLRELGEALEHLAADEPLVLVLEDLHWSDASTIDALAHIAQRTVEARLLVVGTYRSDAAPRSDRPLQRMRRHLQARGLCSEITLEPLAPEHVEQYLVRRLSAHALGDGLGRALHAHSGGHALSLVALVDHLLDRSRLIVQDGVWRLQGALDGAIPAAVAHLVANVVEALPATERRILEAASVAGATFAVAPVARATGLSADVVDACCAALARRRRLVTATGVETWPDGTVSSRYAFVHAVHADVVYDGIAPLARARLHRHVAESIEAGHVGRIGDVAAVLARQFARAGDGERAVRFHGEAARAAKQRSAPREVIAHLDAALALSAAMPAADDRVVRELDYLVELGAATVAAHAYPAPEVAAVYARVYDLAVRLDALPALVTAIGGLYTHHVTRAEFAAAHEHTRELIALGERRSDPLLVSIGRAWSMFVGFSLGELAAAESDGERVRAAWVSGTGVSRLPGHGMSFHGLLARVLLIRGKAPQAAAALAAMLDRAAELGNDPFNRAQAHDLAGQFHVIEGARGPARHHATRALALATEHGLAAHRASALVVHGWATGDAGGIREGLAIHAETGHRVGRSFFLAVLAEALLARGDAEGAFVAVTEALEFATATGEARHLPELHRLRAECLLRRRDADATAEAVTSLRMALEVARRQKAVLWQQRAQAALGAIGRPRLAVQPIARDG